MSFLTALRLGQQGIDTIVRESHDALVNTTHASVYMPVVIPVLPSFDILDLLESHTFLNHEGPTWRTREGLELAHMPLTSDTPGEHGGVLQLGQKKMADLLFEEPRKHPNVRIDFGFECVRIEDLPKNKIKVMSHQSKLPDHDVLYYIDYILGTDGANSSVRRIMCIPYDGFTW